MDPVWIAIAIFLTAFALLYGSMIERWHIMCGGGAVMLFSGWIMGFYDPAMAFGAISFDTLTMIFGMSMITEALARSGIFAVYAAKSVLYVRNDGKLALVLLILSTYTVSLVVNNLTALMIILPVALPLCRVSGMAPTPVVIALIVASNLGGASTMIGDFPNMIIAGVAHIHFLDFIGGMMPPCLILLAATLLFFISRRSLQNHRIDSGHGERHALLREIRILGKAETKGERSELPGRNGMVDIGLYRLGMTVLILALGGFLLSGWWNLRPAWIAFAAGAVLMVFGGEKRTSLPQAMGSDDILFFLGLFVLVGGVQAAGLLDGIGWLIEKIGMGRPTGRLLALMWIVGLLTPFLNAGPATAFFIPIAQGMSAAMPGNAVWWALSLGVLAGSSAALTGATAGSVAASQMKRYLLRHPEMSPHLTGEYDLSFRAYLPWGIPIMVLFLLLSSFYVVWIGG